MPSSSEREKKDKKRRRREGSSPSHSDESSASDSDSSSSSHHKKKKKHKSSSRKDKKSKKSKKKKKKQKKKDKKFNKELKKAKKLLAKKGVKLDDDDDDDSRAKHSSSSSSSSSRGGKRRKVKEEDKIAEDDYFLKSTELRVWLSEAKGLFFNDLSSEQSRSYFKKFVEKFNAGELPDKYYKGLDATNMQSKTLTRHKWGIKLSKDEQWQLDTTRDTVDTLTHHQNAGDAFRLKFLKGTTKEKAAAAEKELKRNKSNKNNNKHKGGGDKDEDEDAYAREERIHKERHARKKERKRDRKHHEMVMEELVPKKEGHEARMEKKRQKGAYCRPEANDGVADVNEADLMGGGSDYHRMVAKRQQWRQKKQDERSTRLAEYQAKEKEKMKALLGSLGMQDRFNV